MMNQIKFSLRFDRELFYFACMRQYANIITVTIKMFFISRFALTIKLSYMFFPEWLFFPIGQAAPQPFQRPKTEIP